ncbi:MAG: permease, partial [Maricaulis sp.]|nr:permease [Maricaulis sp.]
MQIYLPIAEISVNIFLLLGLGGAIGFLSGLFGVGGGFLMTPILMFIGVPPAVAVSTQAPQIVASSFSGALAHWKRKTLDLKMGGLLLAGGVVGSFFGVQLFSYLRSLGQIDLFIGLSYVGFLGVIGGLMLLESVRSILRSRTGQAVSTPQRRRRSWVERLPVKMRFPSSGL